MATDIETRAAFEVLAEFSEQTEATLGFISRKLRKLSYQATDRLFKDEPKVMHQFVVSRYVDSSFTAPLWQSHLYRTREALDAHLRKPEVIYDIAKTIDPDFMDGALDEIQRWLSHCDKEDYLGTFTATYEQWVVENE